MTGADRVKVTPQGQPLTQYGVGDGKQVSDLMGPDVAIAWTGTKGAVTGNFLKVTEFIGFSETPEEQEGHYFAFELDEQYEGKKITVIGAHQKTAQDRYWVIRLDELYNGSKKLTVKQEGDVLFTLDFTGATLAEA